jgi:DNA modification methylase
MKTKPAALASLKPHPKNVRVGDVQLIKDSLQHHGQYRPIVVQQSTSHILAGNHTYKAAKELGWETIEATFIDVDNDQALRILLMDNRANDKATYDTEELVGLLDQLLDTDLELTGTGFSMGDLTELLADIDTPDKDLGDVDEIPEPPAVPVSKLGDVWLLGKHRLVCGDATKPEDYQKLLNGETVDLVWTDPPYGVAIVGGNRADTEKERLAKGGLTIENDDLNHAQLTDFLRITFTIIRDQTKKGACWYVAAPSGNLFQCFSIPLTELEIWKHTLVWVKDSLVMGRADYHYRHESIFYGWTQGAAHQPPPDRKQDTVWEIARPKANKEHPTMKPIELITRAINNSSNINHIVLDPFGGSGSTLIAAEQTNRVARLLELDPKYVDVICRRYQQITGTQPVLEATNQPHDFCVE